MWPDLQHKITAHRHQMGVNGLNWWLVALVKSGWLTTMADCNFAKTQAEGCSAMNPTERLILSCCNKCKSRTRHRVRQEREIGVGTEHCKGKLAFETRGTVRKALNNYSSYSKRKMRSGNSLSGMQSVKTNCSKSAARNTRSGNSLC